MLRNSPLSYVVARFSQRYDQDAVLRHRMSSESLKQRILTLSTSLGSKQSASLAH